MRNSPRERKRMKQHIKHWLAGASVSVWGMNVGVPRSNSGLNYSQRRLA